MSYRRNARQQWPGVFLCLLGLFSAAGWGGCPEPGVLQQGRLAAVVDGDTLRLQDGRKLRLIAVNTPELGHNGLPDQPLAREAKQAVQQFFQGRTVVGWRSGVEARDHYGRQLAHVFRDDGQSLSAFLLERGLGWRIAIPPNLDAQKCFASREAQARAATLGVWGEPAYRVKPSHQLTAADAGFGRVAGTVRAVTETASGWWIELPGLSLRLSRRDQKYFARGEPRSWQGKRIIVRGWIIDRRQSPAVKERGYAPFMMSVRHPSMVHVDT